jgi:hypothetical protein
VFPCVRHAIGSRVARHNDGQTGPKGTTRRSFEQVGTRDNQLSSIEYLTSIAAETT